MKEIEVEALDSLFGIAKRELGDGMRWPEIWEVNRDVIEREIRKRIGRNIPHPEDHIWPGMKLRIPS